MSDLKGRLAPSPGMPRTAFSYQHLGIHNENRLHGLSSLSRLRPMISGNEEPTLKELFDDPIIHILMKRDGVAMTSLLALIGKTKERLQDISENAQQ
ncbi:MAG: hypothetical protein HQL45_10230 [Alphaproteobacteria bacterium]|nr:hypothetical protein [Alphaproteobacteria bacterium]